MLFVFYYCQVIFAWCDIDIFFTYALLYQQNIPQHQPEMTETACHYKQVEYFMHAKPSGSFHNPVKTIKDCADSIQYTAKDKPENACNWYCLNNIKDGKAHHPSHEDVDKS